MTDRVAIIDLGSNTARLVALAYEPGRQWRQIDELRERVRLAEAMGGGGPGEAPRLHPAAFERGIEALVAFRVYCDATGIDRIRAAATSAVRDAANGGAFLAAARERAGLELEVLSGEQEAEAGALAVANSFDLEDALVLDLGGGSAQLSRLRDRRFAGGGSWPLGAVRATEEFFAGDPPTRQQVRALAERTRDWLGAFVDASAGLPLVAMGGTARNLAQVHQKRLGYPVDLLHNYRLPLATLEELTGELLERTAAEREGLPGLSRDRADIVAAGAVVILEVARLAGAEELVVSGQGLREGLFYPYLYPHREGHVADSVRDAAVLNLVRAYYDFERHNRHVQKLALALFDELRPWHPYGAAERELLGHAALLHDIGMAINYRDHHKHGLFLVMGRPLPGFTHREQALLGLLVRYHRKGAPNPQGMGDLLEEGDLERLRRLGGMLRLAEYLERSKAQRVRGLRCRLEPGRLRVEAFADGDATVEVREAQLHADLLADAFGVTVEVAAARTPAATLGGS